MSDEGEGAEEEEEDEDEDEEEEGAEEGMALTFPFGDSNCRSGTLC